ncbi:MAG: hypothetical protein IPM32_06570 [Ignavibacteriae bacterium]|nr:hypothetical protein [Ignavibacteriota bacterium]
MKTLLLLLIIFVILASCRDTVTNPTNEEIKEESFYPNSLQVHSPLDTDKWEQNNTYKIKWAITDNLDYVKIDLIRKFNKVMTIAESTENDGIFEWKIPSNLSGSHHYRIQILHVNNNAYYRNSAEFEITPLSTSSENIDTRY